jgi:hypothetical protein
MSTLLIPGLVLDRSEGGEATRACSHPRRGRRWRGGGRFDALGDAVVGSLAFELGLADADAAEDLLDQRAAANSAADGVGRACMRS